jgi:hypothetical protein
MSEPTSASSRDVSRRKFFVSTGTGLAMSAAATTGLTGCAPGEGHRRSRDDRRRPGELAREARRVAHADLVLLAANTINVMPLNHAYGSVVLGMDTSNVDTVFVGGRVKKWKGQLVGVDIDQLRARAEHSRDYIVAQAKWPRTVLGGYLPGH